MSRAGLSSGHTGVILVCAGVNLRVEEVLGGGVFLAGSFNHQSKLCVV